MPASSHLRLAPLAVILALVAGCTGEGGLFPDGDDDDTPSGDGGSIVDRFAGQWVGEGTRRIVCTGACSEPGPPCSASFPCSGGQTCNADAQCEGPLDTGVVPTSFDLTFTVVGNALHWSGPCDLMFDHDTTTAAITAGARCPLDSCNGQPSYYSWDRAELTLTGDGLASWINNYVLVQCGGAAAGGNDHVGTFSGTVMRQP